MASTRNDIICSSGELLPPPERRDGGDGCDAWIRTPNPHRRLQKVERESQVPSCALQMSGISLNDEKCQTLSLLLKFLCWAGQPLVRSSAGSAW